ncbi:MAG: M64 family metallopeptidase [Oscillospiraceae bacterium]
MKKKLLSLFLSLALVLSLCPAAFAAGTDAAVGELKLVYGDTTLRDEDAMVLLIMGDGFTAGEQTKFYEEAKKTAAYIMQCSPYDEFTDTIKIYALGVASNESGVTGANAGSVSEVANDKKDTYFGASFWTMGMQRLVDLTAEGAEKGRALQKQYLPAADFCLYLVNSTVYGGSGGEYCTASLNTSSYEMMLHEMGHTVAGLADEYYSAGYAGEYANLTTQSDPESVRWSRFVGANGVGVYAWGGNANSGYYVPSQNCKMQYLGAQYEFCEVCKEEIRKAICQHSNVTKVFFQPYADEFLEGSTSDMKQYFIVRRGENEITGDKLGNYLYVVYYYNGSWQKAAPTGAGEYYVCAYLYGCTIDGVTYEERDYTDSYLYSIQSSTYQISLNVSSKVYDGKPANVQYTVKPLKDEYKKLYESGEHFVSVDYYVTPYSDPSASYYYGDRCDGSGLYDLYDGNTNKLLKENVAAPSMAGDYEVTVSIASVKGNDWTFYASKSASYAISLRSTKIIDNNDDNYYGAYSYGNNKTVMIYGEGFSAEEQDKFDALAAELTNGIRAQEPFKELQLYFNFMSVNTVSNDSGVGTASSKKDTFFGLTYDPKTGAVPATYDNCHSATNLAANMCYSYVSTTEGAVSVIIVNDENVTDCSVYAPYSQDATYHYYQTIYVTPNDEDWTEYAAAEVLNYLAWDGPGYRAETEEAKAAQRLDVLKSMSCTYENAFAPVIVSQAYNETFVANGQPVDLAPYFHVYKGAEEIFGVKLKLTYYDANGKALSSAPSQPGTYSVKAETVADPDYADDPSGWQLYQPTSADEELWIGISRGRTTFTIRSEDGFFTDIGKDHVFRSYVEYVYENGIMNGKSATRFDAASSFTRVQLVVTLYRMAGSPSTHNSTTLSFSDTTKLGTEFANAVKWAVANNIVGGYEDGTFRPNTPVTRQAMMTILYRYAGSLGLDVSVSGSDNLAQFKDGSQVSPLMTDSVSWAVAHGFVGGNAAGNLNPTGSATRGAAAKILTGFHKSYIA